MVEAMTVHFVTSLPLAVMLLAGCVGDPEPLSCAEQTGMERDQCYHDEILKLPGAQIDGVSQRAVLIEDQMVRQAAISAWVPDHNNEIPRDKGEALCRMLDGGDLSKCLRQLSSPHLQKPD